METQVQRPEQREDVHQDEQNHRRHDECHLQLVVAHPTRCFKRMVGLHILLTKLMKVLWNGSAKEFGGKDGRTWLESWQVGRLSTHASILPFFHSSLFQPSNLPIVIRRSSQRPQRFPHVFG